MPKLTGVFEQFNNLDQISLENITKSLSYKMDVSNVANYLGNRILYPQTIPLTNQEMELDIAILREAVSLSPSVLYSTDKGITITEEFENRFKPLSKLAEALIDVLPLGEETGIFLKSGFGTIPIGSVVKLPISSPSVSIILEAQVYQLKRGSLTLLPCLSKNAQLTVDKKVIVVQGGKLGVLIDLRGGV